MNDDDKCPICGGTGEIVLKSDTLGGKRTTPCDCCSTVGVLYIHRDIPGVHTFGPTCWCVCHRIQADDPRTTIEIIRDMERKEIKQ